MIMDLNKKISFRCSAEKLELPDDYDEDLCDEVNSDLFWRKAELSKIVRGFGRMEIPVFQVESLLLNWAPYIGKHTRAQP